MRSSAKQSEPSPQANAKPRITRTHVFTAAVVVAAVMALRVLTIEAFTIPTPSMEPSLLVGDFVLVERAAYGLDLPLGVRLPGYRTPERGDIVVFHPPHSSRMSYVKRLLGLPGDTIQMRDGRLLINGVAVQEPYAVLEEMEDGGHPGMEWQIPYLAPGIIEGEYHPTRDQWGPLIIPEEHLFLLGDNRGHSADSRFWGFVPDSALSGKPLLVYFSLNVNPADVHWLRRIRWGRTGHLIR